MLEEARRRMEADADGLDETSEADRLWFEAHPDKHFRLREATAHEKSVGIYPEGVLVCQIQPGLRARIDAVDIGVPYENAPDEVCLYIFEFVTSLTANTEVTQRLRDQMSKKFTRKLWRNIQKDNTITELMLSSTNTKH